MYQFISYVCIAIHGGSVIWPEMIINSSQNLLYSYEIERRDGHGGFASVYVKLLCHLIKVDKSRF